ncbi:1-deoxy-D-xylulose-5-phosphate synthase [candidate division WOR-1 bacterium RIFOXYA12_FULL_52_29]|uniref:1-deoxy-D-xylulose-5-phosphate synthase n=1 Tax=candidate division WOR-1 bacterium RIFOXYC12_FULL_54_18 TaxID=1802584 RepID=A0A1F4T4T3_UNCSA|nr:MAG: 1-deoxy-D-xylulose-5-phosphate synthase [candidate division WOR-1 bacterium RIFOXYA2_FULL_51_19]OGC17301.1 MAG: 1-deoxy-D-xylulose-5-phosphate synthase [candidate division WOR-1 bacterium RIFOXYA12_FULL_52_29]OGC26161.1 MAG: 1-deoxy-D-xylulose-5-phosphate synthase [candidate division WOR-1 bacterium RIFOXYB2_FULL_45_9]OGC27718.1 MAG: 1-deoxy-D-xylulose-5-phosphate synthase [candidate division WOR-1 bacterium RIFOXYC12_FULL_54_18]OGC29991.1 MAG: 1-deoxy-D-xylulose-5-phosphate synthase [c
MSTLLDKLKLPEALRELSTKQLEDISQEIRQKIVEVASKNGGHVASSLGAVEIAVSLHASFNSPRDRIIWDVGHQAYAHKILTGRLSNFHTLRQENGLSGFPNIDESPHDPFTVGHASTSISQAVGLAHARDLAGEKNHIVAVIGDGSLSGGLSYEAINNASSLKSNMIVILNDNEMSISRNVGALSNYLTRFSTSGAYLELRNRIEGIVKKIPRVGVSLFDAAKTLKDRTKHIVVNFKVDVIFEQLGFKYFGPIDGHNIPLIMSTLHHAKEIQGPVLIHVLTKKGKGYPPAEKEPTRFHGTGPFDIKTGAAVKSDAPKSYTAVFGETLVKLADADPKIVGITAAMIDGTGLEEFCRKHPARFFDVGIAEEHAVTFAGGLAKGGFKPFLALYSTFLQRAYDEIVHDVCLQNLPVVFAIDRAGIVGEDGATHNGIFDLAFLRSLPNISVMAPKDENEFQQMLYSASKAAGPVAIRYPRGSGIGVALNNELRQLTIGRGEIVHKGKGAKILAIAIGSMVHPTIEASKLAEANGDGVTVINARFVKPLDRELILKEAKKAERIVTVEEGVLEGGFGSAILELLTEEGLTKPIKRLGFPSKFIEHGKRPDILEKYGLSPDKIARSL